MSEIPLDNIEETPVEDIIFFYQSDIADKF